MSTPGGDGGADGAATIGRRVWCRSDAAWRLGTLLSVSGDSCTVVPDGEDEVRAPTQPLWPVRVHGLRCRGRRGEVVTAAPAARNVLTRDLAVRRTTFAATLARAPDTQSITVPVEDTHTYDPTHGLYSSDVAQLNNLHEAPLLDLLRRRFLADDIYVRRGRRCGCAAAAAVAVAVQ